MMNKQYSLHSEKDLFEGLEIKCLKENQGQFYCAEENCQQFPIICAEKQCECYKVHENCRFYHKVDSLHKSLNKNLIGNFDDQQVMKKFENIKREIPRLQLEIQEQFEYFGLSAEEGKMAKMIKLLSQGKSFCHRSFSQYKKTNNSNRIYNFHDSLIEFKKIMERSKLRILKAFNDLENQIIDEHIKYYKKNTIENLLKSNIVYQASQVRILNSLINSQFNISGLERIYSDYDVKELDLKKLFKASENQSQLVFLIENTKGKKFGALSRIPIRKNTQAKFENLFDRMQLFSIDQNFKLQNMNVYQIQNRLAYIQNSKQEFLAFEFFNKLNSQSHSFLKIQPNKCLFYVANQDKMAQINGHNPGGFLSSLNPPRVQNIQVFKVKFRHPPPKSLFSSIKNIQIKQSLKQEKPQQIKQKQKKKQKVEELKLQSNYNKVLKASQSQVKILNGQNIQNSEKKSQIKGNLTVQKHKSEQEQRRNQINKSGIFQNNKQSQAKGIFSNTLPIFKPSTASQQIKPNFGNLFTQLPKNSKDSQSNESTSRNIQKKGPTSTNTTSLFSSNLFNKKSQSESN